MLYPALDGGGFDLVVHTQIAIVTWWLVLLGAAFALLPFGQIARPGWTGLALFGGFVAWTALSITWSIGSGRTLAALSLVIGYLGTLALGVALAGDRALALRHVVGALAASIVLVAVLALVSRLHPGLFPAAQVTSAFLPGTANRLAWPLNYWNALGALLALGVPLLLAVTTSSRRLAVQAVAAGSLPVVILCGYLTFSRGAAIAGIAAVVGFLALTGGRLAKLPTVVIAAGGSAVLIATAESHRALERGLATAAARSDGTSLILPIVLVVLVVGASQVAIRHFAPRLTPQALPRVPRSARRAVGAVSLCVVALALAVVAPPLVSRAWRNFKHPTSAALGNYSVTRFDTVSGNGRYQYWKVALNATSGERLQGSGAGTFQLLWLPRATYPSFVENAHSLYVETLAELGVVGLLLLVAFLVAALVAAIRAVVAASGPERTCAAAVAAAMTAFCLSAAFDWIWQVAALPAAFMVMTAAVVAPRARRSPGSTATVESAAAVESGAAVAPGMEVGDGGSAARSSARSGRAARCRPRGDRRALGRVSDRARDSAG